MIDVTDHAEGCVLPVRAQPGAKRSGIVGERGGALKVAVTAPPDAGRYAADLATVCDRFAGWPEPRSGATPALATYFPPSESRGGWRSLLPARGEPSAEQKSKIREIAGVDWDRLKAAWDHNAAAPGATGMVVVRRGHVVGEWYKDGDRTTAFKIYSSSKSYMSTAFGLILADFGNGKLPDGRTLLLDTKVCNEQWIPESLPLPDPRKADITVRHLLNMASGLTEEQPSEKMPYESSLGHLPQSPFKKLKADPGKEFHYSNAGVAHLVLAFHNAAGEDELPWCISVGDHKLAV